VNDSCLPPPLPPLPNIVSVVITFFQIALSSNSLIQALFPGLIVQKNVGRDVWSYLEEDPRKFWYLTGDTPQSLDILVHMISHEVGKPRMLPRTPLTGRRRCCILDIRNRVLSVIIWLRSYPTYHTLASIFNISKSTVHEEIYHIVPILFIRLRTFLTWHNLRRWSSFMGYWSHFPNAVGIIDGTIHRIRRPSGRLQAEFYRGDKKTHFMSTQLIVDADGMIVLLVSEYVAYIKLYNKYVYESVVFRYFFLIVKRIELPGCAI